MQRTVIISFLGLYLVFNVTAAYKKPYNRTEREALKIRIVMRFVAGCTKVLEPLSKTPRDNQSPYKPHCEAVCGNRVINLAFIQPLSENFLNPLRFSGRFFVITRHNYMKY